MNRKIPINIATKHAWRSFILPFALASTVLGVAHRCKAQGPPPGCPSSLMPKTLGPQQAFRCVHQLEGPYRN